LDPTDSKQTTALAGRFSGDLTDLTKPSFKRSCIALGLSIEQPRYLSQRVDGFDLEV
jgi:hypothetical protein